MLWASGLSWEQLLSGGADCPLAVAAASRSPLLRPSSTNDDVRSMHVQEDVSSELIGVHPVTGEEAERGGEGS